MRPATTAPAAVYLLADNLDKALAAGEDLLKSSLVWNGGSTRATEDIVAHRGEERQALEEMRTLEMVLVARVLKSRERAAELAKLDPHLKMIAKLYNSGTVILTDAIEELGDTRATDFEAGGGLTAYLRSRGLIASDVPAPPEAACLTVTEEFLIAGRIPLGALMDLVAMFLDKLEMHYDLYEGTERGAFAALAIPPLAADTAEAAAT
jgi:hypothetical protein